MKRCLLSITTGKYKLLVRDSKNVNVCVCKVFNWFEFQISDSDTFAYNLDFKSAHVRVKIGVNPKKETDEELKKTRKRIEAERIPVIEAAIVRIMKARKQMTSVELMDQVVKQLQQRFIPTVQEMKLRIDNLIEREYLTRDPNDRSLFQYVA